MLHSIINFIYASFGKKISRQQNKPVETAENYLLHHILIIMIFIPHKFQNNLHLKKCHKYEIYGFKLFIRSLTS